MICLVHHRDRPYVTHTPNNFAFMRPQSYCCGTPPNSSIVSCILHFSVRAFGSCCFRAGKGSRPPCQIEMSLQGLGTSVYVYSRLTLTGLSPESPRTTAAPTRTRRTDEGWDVLNRETVPAFSVSGSSPASPASPPIARVRVR